MLPLSIESRQWQPCSTSILLVATAAAPRYKGLHCMVRNAADNQGGNREPMLAANSCRQLWLPGCNPVRRREGPVTNQACAACALHTPQDALCTLQNARVGRSSSNRGSSYKLMLLALPHIQCSTAAAPLQCNVKS